MPSMLENLLLHLSSKGRLEVDAIGSEDMMVIGKQADVMLKLGDSSHRIVHTSTRKEN